MLIYLCQALQEKQLNSLVKRHSIPMSIPATVSFKFDVTRVPMNLGPVYTNHCLKAVQPRYGICVAWVVPFATRQGVQRSALGKKSAHRLGCQTSWTYFRQWVSFLVKADTTELHARLASIPITLVIRAQRATTHRGAMNCNGLVKWHLLRSLVSHNGRLSTKLRIRLVGLSIHDWRAILTTHF